MADGIIYARVKKPTAAERVCGVVAWLLTGLSLFALLLALKMFVDVSTGPPLPDDWGGVIAVWLLVAFSVLAGGGAAFFSLVMRPGGGRRFVRRYAAANAVTWIVVFFVLLIPDASSRPAMTVLSDGPKQSHPPTSMPPLGRAAATLVDPAGGMSAVVSHARLRVPRGRGAERRARFNVRK